MLVKLFELTQKLWIKITALAVGLGAILAVADYLLKWGAYSYVFNFLSQRAWPTILENFSVPVYVLIVLVICSVLFILQILKGFKRKEYFIPIKSRFHTGFEPNEYSRRTRWNFKQNKDFYFVPLLSHGYNSVDFVDLCGPYCNRCNHILHLKGSREDLGHILLCVNCVEKYKIPKELLGNYQKKLFAYFQEEFRQHRLREAR